MSTKWTFHGKESKHDVYSGEKCMKNCCKCLIEHAMKIIKFEKKKMMPLTNEERNSYLNQANCHICQESLRINILMKKNYYRVRDHCHRTGIYRDDAHSICN